MCGSIQSNHLQNLEYKTGHFVAVKTITAFEENHAITYGLIRIELNKLLSAYHPNVLKFIGITVSPPAIVVEYAPLGSLHDIKKQHREKGHPICPASIALILYQVNLQACVMHYSKAVAIVVFVHAKSVICCPSELEIFK